MPKAKKIFLVRERRETWRVRFSLKRRGFCRQCGEKTVWLTGAEAAGFSGLSEREIFNSAENAQKIHFRENEAGFLLVCRKSLESCRKRLP